jgi:hypothetical protein
MDQRDAALVYHVPDPIRLRESRADDQAYDPDARRRLWSLSEDLVGLVASTDALPTRSA